MNHQFTQGCTCYSCLLTLQSMIFLSKNQLFQEPSSTSSSATSMSGTFPTPNKNINSNVELISSAPYSSPESVVKKPKRQEQVTSKEIVRLWIIMLNPELEELTSGIWSGLTKDQLDSGIDIECIWEKIAKVYNDPNEKVDSKNLHINPNQGIPVRSGVFLREKFRLCRSNFTLKRKEFKLSGSPDRTSVESIIKGKSIYDQCFDDLYKIYEKYGKPSHILREIPGAMDLGFDEDKEIKRTKSELNQSKNKNKRLRDEDEVSSLSVGDSLLQIFNDSKSIQVEKEKKELLQNIKSTQEILLLMKDDDPLRVEMNQVLKNQIDDLKNLQNKKTQL